MLSTHYNAFSFNTAMLVLRLTMGMLMMHFSEKKAVFYNFLSLGSTTSLMLCIFAEFFCALFVMIGLFTRLAAVPLVVVMSIAVFSVHKMDFFDTGEAASLYLAGYLVLLLCGPGRASVDGIASK